MRVETRGLGRRLCPGCGCELRGAGLCELCGATDFDGAGNWICFSCGGANARDAQRCGRCRKLHVIACPACDFEGFHKDRNCESCGAPRALYPLIERALAKAAHPEVLPRTRGRSVATCLLGAVAALTLASALGAAGKRAEAGLLGTGGFAAVVWGLRLSRRRPGSVQIN